MQIKSVRVQVKEGNHSIHNTCHGHTSPMLKAGIHPKVVQERLGHASIQTTLDTYSHVAPGLQDAAARRFDDLVKIECDKVAVENHS